MLARFVGASSRRLLNYQLLATSSKSILSRKFASSQDSETGEPWIPPFVEKIDEPVETKRSRLLYQSRKRGMLENGLLLSSFCAKYLKSMNDDQLTQYDRLINLPSNDWEIYYWVTGAKPTPSEFDTDVMNLLKEHAKNNDREQRIFQPALH